MVHIHIRDKMLSLKKLESNRKNIKKANESGKNRHYGSSNSHWNGGNSFKGHFLCPQCKKDRICEKYNANRLCRECYELRPKKFDKKKWYKELRVRLKQFSIDYLGGKCIDCGVDNLPICCYHFHHKNPKEKEVNIGNLFTVNNEERIKKELDKCILLCANCHAIRHYQDEEFK